MPGFLEEVETAVVFESPLGRILETSAIGRASRQSIFNFYKKSLPELGWKIASETRFYREGEFLKIELRNNTVGIGMVRLLFKIVPGIPSEKRSFK